MNKQSCIAKHLLVLALVGAQANAHACSYPQPPKFSEALDNAVSVAVIRVEEIRLKEKGPQEVIFVPDLDADVRVTETLLGKPVVVKQLSFSSSWCGGHDLKVGGYYVLLLRENTVTIELIPSDPSILYLFGEYDEHSGSKASTSRLLMHLRNYGRLHSFPEAFPIQKYIKHNFVLQPLPPSA